MSSNIVLDKSAHFAERIVRMCRILEKRGAEKELTRQVLRSGSSIIANLSEAQYANSKDDFAYRVRIALRECSETSTWLRLLHATQKLRSNEYKSIQGDCTELLKIMTAISNTVQKSGEGTP